MLRPDKQTHKLLISSTSRLVGEYETEDFFITHAWPGISKAVDLTVALTENPYCRNYFVVVFKSEPSPEIEGHIKRIPDYSIMGEIVCVFLSILFGKRFDDHGLIETNGLFNVPNLGGITPVSLNESGPNNHSPRKDLEIDLNLEMVKIINPILAEKREYVLDIGYLPIVDILMKYN